ncbi:MAG TPA: NAD-dependent epimerase/dehydratase family protein [Thermoanaerobaculia bacterium]|nr:NAD-dependent epimerase/dehydratase family protein [Thermoanaerobaculia bacterium]
MRVLVTGGAGFIATSLIPRLLARGDDVFAVDNFFLGKRRFIEPFLPNERFRFREFDLLDLERVADFFAESKPDLVWHVAANSDISYGTSYTDFDLKGGTIVTYNVLESMRRCGAKELIFSSSGAVYGEPSVMPTPEDYGPLFPISFYAASKVACETLITAFVHNYDMRTWIFRFGNVVGPNPTHGVIYDFVKRLRENPGELRVLGDGSQAKPYVYVEEVLDGIEYGYHHARDAVNCYNLAVEDQTSVREIAEWTIEAMGIDRASIDVRYAGGSRGWRGDVPVVKLDTSRMTRLGWSPKLKSGEAVRRTIAEVIEQFRSGVVS